jgi:hypothetical protein
MSATSQGAAPSTYAPKDGWIAVVAGSTLISALVSAAVGFFVVDKKSQYEIDKDFVALVSNIYREHKEDRELNTVSMLQEVLLPIYENDVRYKPIIVQLISNFSKGLTDSERTKLPNSITGPIAIKALNDANLLASGRSIDEVRQNFYGDLRRQFSDEIVQKINSGSQGDVDLIIDALLSDTDKRSYRVNLYIAFTLGRVRAWTATDVRRQRIADLEKSLNNNDPTFRDAVSKARQKSH